jgi:hypothetical protein
MGTCVNFTKPIRGDIEKTYYFGNHLFPNIPRYIIDKIKTNELSCKEFNPSWNIKLSFINFINAKQLLPTITGHNLANVVLSYIDYDYVYDDGGYNDDCYDDGGYEIKYKNRIFTIGKSVQWYTSYYNYTGYVISQNDAFILVLSGKTLYIICSLWCNQIPHYNQTDIQYGRSCCYYYDGTPDEGCII